MADIMIPDIFIANIIPVLVTKVVLFYYFCKIS